MKRLKRFWTGRKTLRAAAAGVAALFLLSVPVSAASLAVPQATLGSSTLALTYLPGGNVPRGTEVNGSQEETTVRFNLYRVAEPTENMRGYAMTYENPTRTMTALLDDLNSAIFGSADPNEAQYGEAYGYTNTISIPWNYEILSAWIGAFGGYVNNNTNDGEVDNTGVTPDATANVSNQGAVAFQDLPDGIYLVASDQAYAVSGTAYVAAPFVIQLPYVDDSGANNYVSANVKWFTPVTPTMQEEPEDPEEPGTPEEPEEPGTPTTPEDPGTPETPVEPGTVDTPETPEDPGTVDTPETPVDPGTVDTPETPVDPGTVDTPEDPGTPVLAETDTPPEDVTPPGDVTTPEAETPPEDVTTPEAETPPEDTNANTPEAETPPEDTNANTPEAETPPEDATTPEDQNQAVDNISIIDEGDVPLTDTPVILDLDDNPVPLAPTVPNQNNNDTPNSDTEDGPDLSTIEDEDIPRWGGPAVPGSDETGIDIPIVNQPNSPGNNTVVEITPGAPGVIGSPDTNTTTPRGTTTTPQGSTTTNIPTTTIADGAVPLATLPQTGQLWWPVPIMGVCGLGFIAVGVKLRRTD